MYVFKYNYIYVAFLDMKADFLKYKYNVYILCI